MYGHVISSLSCCSYLISAMGTSMLAKGSWEAPACPSSHVIHEIDYAGLLSPLLTPFCPSQGIIWTQDRCFHSTSHQPQNQQPHTLTFVLFCLGGAGFETGFLCMALFVLELTL